MIPPLLDFALPPRRPLAALSVVLGLFAVQAARGDTLDATRARGFVTCGVNIGLAGFGLPDDRGVWRGFDIETCRAVAAAIFDDPNKVKFIPLSSKDRFTALQSGEVDILSHNTTWTQSREVGQGLLFTAINFYDGQGFMVRKSLGIDSAQKLDGASICAQQGTTNELNLADFFRSHGLKMEPVVFATADEAIRAFDSGRCDAFTTDASGLYAERRKLTHPDDNVVLKETISKEPFSPAVRQGDDRWFNLVKWIQFALIDADELGVTARNVDQMKKSTNPEIRRLLGQEGDYGAGLGLTPDWAARIIKAVGNYGEIFETNLGKGSPLKIPRGLNALWRDGGLLYAPPVR